MSIKFGDKISLNGKEYKVVGTKARSYLLERDGKTYKATAAKIEKIQNQDRRVGVDAPKGGSALERRIAFARLFNQNPKMPETEAEIRTWFDTLESELSPENLTCDGELSRSQVRAKLQDINACWAELEAKLGRKVPKNV